jgi:hypothetical protein
VTSKTVPRHCQTIPPHCQTVPPHCQTVPPHCQTVPTIAKPFPTIAKPFPTIAKPFPTIAKPGDWLCLTVAEAKAIGLRERSPNGLIDWFLARRALLSQRGGFSPAQ